MFVTRFLFSLLDEPVVSAPCPASEEDVEKKEEEVEDEGPVLVTQLQLAVEVLTSKSCSEEGLENATNFLLQLSTANDATRDMVLKLLLEAARQLGFTVCDHIR
jgi:E3 ubiquitin-protein ligase HUWE1